MENCWGSKFSLIDSDDPSAECGVLIAVKGQDVMATMLHELKAFARSMVITAAYSSSYPELMGGFFLEQNLVAKSWEKIIMMYV